MPKLARTLTFMAALFLAATLALPIWRISLIAPQYPEGLGMQIRLNTVEGVKQQDLANINELNHYIGMKVIDPTAMPELHYMPWIVGALVAAGLLVALIGRRGPLYGWVAALAAGGAAGLGDFWRWTYDFGHHLDTEHAIIRVPGMVYQPPLIGVKQILNFRAASWPAPGGVLLAVAFGLGAWALVLAVRERGALAVNGSTRFGASVGRRAA